MQAIYGYLIHLLSGIALLGVFVAIYTKITPFDEVALIRQGTTAAALSFVGAMLGFSLTLAASILINDTYLMFLFWAACAGVVQLLAYALLSRVIPQMNEALSQNNVAMGALMGGVSVVVGMINAACLS